jgi:lipopolysaccharide/colanic/teichoic acid biosynthesis glycosyltransferase
VVNGKGIEMISRMDVTEVIGQERQFRRDIELNIDAPEPGDLRAHAPRRLWYLQLKGVFEWILALALVVVASPLLLALALLVRMTSSGPSFYAQTRLGRNGRTYRIIKLRTMVQNAEARTGPVWAAKEDRRITAIGRILRSTHLDELPQLWNVLRGDMGLIGPRPERPEIAHHLERQIPGFRGRLLVRPGITGLAQMSLPADDPEDVELKGLKRKLAHDLYYVREVGPLLDIRIALATPFYFLAAAVDAVRRGLVRSFGLSAERDFISSEHVLSGEKTL